MHIHVSMYLECDSMWVHRQKDVHNRYIYICIYLYTCAHYIFLEREGWNC